MKRFSPLTAVGTVLCLFYFLATTLEARPVTTSVQIPLAGSVFVELTDSSFDEVDLSGMVHIVTSFNAEYPTDPMRISINLEGVSYPAR